MAQMELDKQLCRLDRFLRASELEINCTAVISLCVNDLNTDNSSLVHDLLNRLSGFTDDFSNHVSWDRDVLNSEIQESSGLFSGLLALCIDLKTN